MFYTHINAQALINFLESGVSNISLLKLTPTTLPLQHSRPYEPSTFFCCISLRVDAFLFMLWLPVFTSSWCLSWNMLHVFLCCLQCSLSPSRRPALILPTDLVLPSGCWTGPRFSQPFLHYGIRTILSTSLFVLPSGYAVLRAVMCRRSSDAIGHFSYLWCIVVGSTQIVHALATLAAVSASTYWTRAQPYKKRHHTVNFWSLGLIKTVDRDMDPGNSLFG